MVGGTQSESETLKSSVKSVGFLQEREGGELPSYTLSSAQTPTVIYAGLMRCTILWSWDK